jgi:hypothetical protein
MISGVNRVFPHEGKQYHLQAEDLPQYYPTPSLLAPLSPGALT